MNRFLIYACAIFMAAATSCSSSGSSSEASSEASSDQEIKTSSPKSTESQSGEVSKTDSEDAFGVENVLLPSQLKGKVEVISAEKSVGRYGLPCVTVAFKLLQKVNTSSMCSAAGQMWLMGVGQNENGVDVKELLPPLSRVALWRLGWK